MPPEHDTFHSYSLNSVQLGSDGISQDLYGSVIRAMLKKKTIKKSHINSKTRHKLANPTLEK